MAPTAELLDVYFSSFATWNASPPAGWELNADLTANTIRSSIVDHKMDLSNHSHSLDAFGYYGRFSAQRDSMIRGDALAAGAPIPPRLQVFSAGNNGGWGDPLYTPTASANGYFSLAKDLKNAILVGGWSVANNRVPGSSSLGPASDGRIKPDVVAPSSQIKSTGYWEPGTTILLCTALPIGADHTQVLQQFYGTECGTSLAAPVVSGILALVLEQYAKTRSVDIDLKPPLPSTLRAVIIHTADDVKGPEMFTTSPPVDGPVQAFEGPDFVTGFGLINAARAVDVTSTPVLREGLIGATCEAQTYSFDIVADPGGLVPEVRVTLAWDDLAANPDQASTDPRLINDLDLVLIDPAGIRHYPWLRNQTITNTAGMILPPEQQTCGTQVQVTPILKFPGPVTAAQILAASTGTGPDHLNNVEQVVTSGMAGKWKAVVTGFKLDGPQKYSLIGVPIQPFLHFHPPKVCQTLASFCRPLMFNLCQRYPPLCDKPQIIPLFSAGPRVTFRDPQDRAILDVHQLCTYLGERGGCQATHGASYEIAVGPAPVPIGIELYSGTGKKLAGTSAPDRTARLVLRPDRGGDYFVILSPSATARPGTAYDIPVRVRVVDR
jgi:hypothetical protein